MPTNTHPFPLPRAPILRGTVTRVSEAGLIGGGTTKTPTTFLGATTAAILLLAPLCVSPFVFHVLGRPFCEHALPCPSPFQILLRTMTLADRSREAVDMPVTFLVRPDGVPTASLREMEDAWRPVNCENCRALGARPGGVSPLVRAPHMRCVPVLAEWVRRVGRVGTPVPFKRFRSVCVAKRARKLFSLCNL